MPLFGGDGVGGFAILSLRFGSLRLGRFHGPRILVLDRRGLLGLRLGRPQDRGQPSGPGQKLLGGLRGGYFVDLAANDPVRLSNSKTLEAEFGWSGLCIEGDSTLADSLRTDPRQLHSRGSSGHAELESSPGHLERPACRSPARSAGAGKS